MNILYIFFLILILFVWLLNISNKFKYILNKTSGYDMILKIEKLLKNLFVEYEIVQYRILKQ